MQALTKVWSCLIMFNNAFQSIGASSLVIKKTHGVHVIIFMENAQKNYPKNYYCFKFMQYSTLVA